MFSFVQRCKIISRGKHTRRFISQRIPPAVSGPDWRIPPAPGTNQIAGFVEYRPLTNKEKNKIRYLWEISAMIGIFDSFANIILTPHEVVIYTITVS